MSVPADQVDLNGVIATDSNAQVQALYPGNTLTPTTNFNFPWNGSTVQFFNGITAEIEPGLLAALTAAGAPFTQP